MARERYYVGSRGPFFFDPEKTRPDGSTQAAFSVGGQTVGSSRVDIIGTESSPAQSTEGFLMARVDGSTGRIRVGDATGTIIDLLDSQLTSPTYQVGAYEVNLSGNTAFLHAFAATTEITRVLPQDLPHFSVSTTVVAPSTVEFEAQLKDNNGAILSQTAFLRLRVSETTKYVAGSQGAITAKGNTEEVEAFTADKDIVLKSNTTGKVLANIDSSSNKALDVAIGAPPVDAVRAPYDFSTTLQSFAVLFTEGGDPILTESGDPLLVE